MQLQVGLDDLSDEGLDLMLRVALKTDVRYIDDWAAMGRLLERRKVTVTHVSDSLWSAEMEDEGKFSTAETEFGEHPRAAIARLLIRAHFPDGPTIRIPKSQLMEMLRKDYLNGVMGKNAIAIAESLAAVDLLKAEGEISRQGTESSTSEKKEAERVTIDIRYA